MEEEKKEYAFKRPHEGHNDANFDLLAKSELLTGENTVNAVEESTEKQINSNAENTQKLIDSNAEISGNEITAFDKITSSLGETLSTHYDSNTLLLIDALNTSLDALNKTLEDGIDVKDDIKKIEDDITVLQGKVQSNTDLIDSFPDYCADVGTSIPSGSDLNDYTTAGKYYVVNAATASSLENCPYSVYAWAMLVIRVSQTAGRVFQIILAPYSCAIYIRSYYNSWTSWYRVDKTEV